jgi:hypothetical protein
MRRIDPAQVISPATCAMRQVPRRHYAAEYNPRHEMAVEAPFAFFAFANCQAGHSTASEERAWTVLRPGWLLHFLRCPIP